jgi:DNA repair photolyase
VKQKFPIIISASRATDIPGLYGDWFIYRIKKGFFIKKNPFNGSLSEVMIDRTELIVFWTKNAKPFIKKLGDIESIIPDYYFQFTLNYYDSEIEPGIPPFLERLMSFKELSERIGRERVIWRFDPLFLTEDLTIDRLIERVHFAAESVYNFTDKMVFSFIDIDPYLKVKRKLSKSGIRVRVFEEEEMIEFSEKINPLGKMFKLGIATCGETIDLSNYGIEKNKCIDDALIASRFSHNENLQKYIKVKRNLIDPGQRKSCGCIVSTDIGVYNTCTHHCVYCYANHSKESVNKHVLEFRNLDNTYDKS